MRDLFPRKIYRIFIMLRQFNRIIFLSCFLKYVFNYSLTLKIEVPDPQHVKLYRVGVWHLFRMIILDTDSSSVFMVCNTVPHKEIDSAIAADNS